MNTLSQRKKDTLKRYICYEKKKKANKIEKPLLLEMVKWLRSTIGTTVYGKTDMKDYHNKKKIIILSFKIQCKLETNAFFLKPI